MSILLEYRNAVRQSSANVVHFSQPYNDQDHNCCYMMRVAIKSSHARHSDFDGKILESLRITGQKHFAMRIEYRQYDDDCTFVRFFRAFLFVIEIGIAFY